MTLHYYYNADEHTLKTFDDETGSVQEYDAAQIADLALQRLGIEAGEPPIPGYNTSPETSRPIEPSRRAPAKPKTKAKAAPAKTSGRPARPVKTSRGKLSDQDLERIRKRYEAGEPTKAIGADYGVSGEAIRYQAKSRGWVLPDTVNRKGGRHVGSPKVRAQAPADRIDWSKYPAGGKLPPRLPEETRQGVLAFIKDHGEAAAQRRWKGLSAERIAKIRSNRPEYTEPVSDEEMDRRARELPPAAPKDTDDESSSDEAPPAQVLSVLPQGVRRFRCTNGHRFNARTDSDDVTCGMPGCGATAWEVDINGRAL